MSERIKAVIAEAAEVYFQALERDGYRPEGCDGGSAATSILAALKAARIAVVELPEPDMVGDYGSVWTNAGGERFQGPVGDVQYRPESRDS